MSAIVGYSSQVALRLRIGDKELALAQVGRRDLILKFTADALPPCDAELLINVDGQLRRTAIVLPKGIQAESRRVEYF
jgi:hypothetical protein